MQKKMLKSKKIRPAPPSGLPVNRGGPPKLPGLPITAGAKPRLFYKIYLIFVPDYVILITSV